MGRPGRKPGKNNKVNYGTRLPKGLVSWLRRQDNQALAIEEALVSYYKLSPPKESDGSAFGLAAEAETNGRE